MEFPEKLSTLRRREGLSQEQLADKLGVTRQSVSKWESGSAAPELGKLIALSELFGVSVDYLVKAYVEEPKLPMEGESDTARIERKLDALARKESHALYQFTSQTRLFGVPLVSIRFGRDRSPTRDTLAIGILAIGNFSVGLVSIGMISLGGLSLGMISLGALALGAVSIGALAVGVSAVGVYAVGVAASGLRLAMGVAASGAAAVGREASGSHVLLWGDGLTRVQVSQFLATHCSELSPPLRALLSFLGVHLA